MAADGTRSGRVRTYGRTAVDALAYAVVVAAVTILLALVAGVATGDGIVGAKVVLFLAGWLLLGVATLRLWPKSPKEVATESGSARPSRTSSPSGDTRIEAVADSLPPLRWMEPAGRRLSPPAKLFVGSVLVLAASLVLEVVFGVE